MKGTTVTYVDPFGKEHDALVTAENGLHPGFLTLVYVDVDAPEAENVKKLFDIAHVSDPSKKETNPALPTYQVNAWKEHYESHHPLPADHPQNDHPFHPVERDQEGIPIPVNRPEYMAEVQAHQAPSAEDLDKVAEEQKAAQATGGAVNPSALEKLKALAANFHSPGDVTAQLDHDAKASDSDATGSK